MLKWPTIMWLTKLSKEKSKVSGQNALPQQFSSAFHARSCLRTYHEQCLPLMFYTCSIMVRGVARVPQGSLMCSIRGTNNQLQNIFYMFVHLQLFNTKIKLFILLFDVKFLFSENHVFRKQKRTTLYGLMDARPKFRILKLTRKNDDLLSLRHK